MDNHDILRWTAPQPFWAAADGPLAGPAGLSRPRILRFAHDEFMDELLATLEQDPASLVRWQAVQETWRGVGAPPAAEPSRWLERSPTRLLGVQRSARAKARALLATAAAAPTTAVAPAPALKLYQAAHQRHYLVAGSLVCQSAGLPDRHVDPARQRVSFVVRRLMPKVAVPRDAPLPAPADLSAWDEYAYVLHGKAGEWRKVAPAGAPGQAALLAAGEERLPMFPASHAQDDGHRRRLYLGSVPVGRREAYQAAAAGAAPPPGGESAAARAARLGAMDPRLALLHTQVLGPWRSLVSRALKVTAGGSQAEARPDWVYAPTGGPPPTGFDRTKPDLDTLRSARSAMQTSSWYLLLDLRNFLRDHVPAYWSWLQANAGGAPPAGTPLAALHAALANVVTPPGLKGGAAQFGLNEAGGAYAASDIADDLPAALRRLGDAEADQLEEALGGKPGRASADFEIPHPAPNVAKPPGWPTFLFLFADPWHGLRTPVPTAPSPAGDYLSEKLQQQIDALAGLVEAALPAEPTTEPLPEPGLASFAPADMRDAWYVMRLAYERPDCAPFETAVVSAPTEPFRMAGFFDADAPARPIRIGLPLDPSPAGLRKFDKNTVFMLSDMMCGQVDRMKGLGLADLVLSVLPFPFHKGLSVPDKGPCKDNGGASLGMMCSLSIPIITICALLLVTIIVSLLDFVFRWLPYFIVCFPLPGFRGRKPDGS